MVHTCKSSFRRLKQDWEFKAVSAASEALFHKNKRKMRIMRRRGKGEKGKEARRRGEVKRRERSGEEKEQEKDETVKLRKPSNFSYDPWQSPYWNQPQILMMGR